MARPKGPVTLERERRRTEATAYHEAGHAVVALALRRKIRHVSIIPDHSYDPDRPETLEMASDGRVEFAPPPKGVRPYDTGDPRNRVHAEAIVMTSLAGALAEGRYFDRHSWKRLSVTDRRGVDSLAMIHCGATTVMPLNDEGVARFQEHVKESTGRYVEWLACRTRTILEANWPIVEAVAAALVERRELTGREVDEIANEVFRNRPRPPASAAV